MKVMKGGNMKNLIKKLAGLLMVLSVALFAGCSDSSDRANEAPQTAKTYTVSGKISIGNAVPETVAKSIASASEGASSNARSATSSFDTDTITYTKTKWEAEATSVDNPSVYIVGKIDPNEKTYSFKLPQGNWNLRLQLLGSFEEPYWGNLIVYNESNVEVTGNIDNKNVVLSPEEFAIYKNGALNLTITDETTGSKIKTVTCELEYKTSKDSARETAIGERLAEIKEKNYSSAGSVTIDLGDVPAGSYEATFTFKDSSGNKLYACKENITVFSGWTTDTWLGEGAHLKKNAEGVTNFVITEDDIYTVENVPETNMVLYEATAGTYKYCLSDTATATVPETTEYSSSSNRFAFDGNGKFYCMDGNNVISNNTNANGKEITIDSDLNIQYFTIDRATGALYVYAYKSVYNSTTHGYDETGKLYKFPKLVSDGDVEEKITFEDSTYELSTSLFVVNNGTLYAVSLRGSGHPLYKADVSAAAGGSLNLSQIATISDIPVDNYVQITDMLYQDECVYILFRQSHLAFDSDESDNKKIYARGAVVRVNLFSNRTDVCGWTSDHANVENKYLYAYQSYYSTSSIYYYTVDGKEVNVVTTVGELGIGSKLGFGKDKFFTPDISASLSQEAFYSPKKFIAIKPKKLVIADDGVAFYTDANDALRYKKVNRVVTVDLERFAIEEEETEDASVEFDDDSQPSLLFVACMCNGDFKSQNLYRSDNKTAIANGTVINYKEWNDATEDYEEKTETINIVADTDTFGFFGIPQ